MAASARRVGAAALGAWRPALRGAAGPPCGTGRAVADVPGPSLSTRPPSQEGLKEFLDIMPQEGEEKIHTGRAWLASELRLKSFDDLHRLWFVCLKEKNRLLARRYSYQAANARMPDADRLWKVRKTMARIKTVLTERALTYQDPQLRMALKRVINAV